MKSLILTPLSALFFLPLHLSNTKSISGRHITEKPVMANAEKDLFSSDEVLQIKLTGNVRDALGDRSKNPKYYDFSVVYQEENGTEASAPVRVRTRGHFRKDKSNCGTPPLLLNFTNKNQTESSLFYNRDKVKLVMPCKGDEYVVREYLIYKLYNLITPRSFRARLVKVTLDDSIRKKTTGPFYGVLLEEEESVAKRNGMKPVEPKMLKPHQADSESFLTMAVFQYMVGNTDWSTQYRQNLKFLVKEDNDLPVPVPYDFDHAGLVDAPYAQPAEELQMRSVTERRYRGYCATDMTVFDPVFAKFKSLKQEFYKVYSSCTMLDAKFIKSATKFLDDFYATLDNPKAVQKDFGYPCDKNGTGNIVIKGLREDD